jgi:hypothetical protein
MRQRWYRMWPVLLVSGVILAVLAVAPLTVGATDLSVSTGQGPNGQTAIILAGNGFGPGEPITITGYTLDGHVAQFPGTTGNSIGAFQTTLSFQPGVVRLQATGQLTGITALKDVGPAWVQPPGFVPIYPRLSPCDYFEGGYYWGYCAPAFYGPTYGPPPAPPAPPAPAATTQPTQPTTTTTNMAKVGQAVAIPAAGFNAGETVLVTLTDATGKATPGASTQADANGNATITVTFPSAGNWTVMIKGQASGKQGTIQYSVS